ncbi:hypothetical protein [Methylomonas koyamae]|uniref:hypothetical protein n=2 Tax=Methylomonas koyamae TaxID=702114 RepID=UPI001C337187|nr:hypothetical protein [Methylomonas koyamae]BBL58515.1 hypothetical protein MKFW12EY_21280 [Methylomonas koyamae]
MRNDCINAVAQALGRPLKAIEAQKIEQRIREQKVLLANKDRAAYLGMSEAQRLQAAAKAAAEQIKADALKKQQRIGLTILANQRLSDYFERQPGAILDSIDRVLAPRFDGQDHIQSAETKYRAVFNEYTRSLSDAIDAFGPKLLGILQNDAAMVPVFRELRGTDTGNPEAKAFAGRLRETFEAMRNRFNNNGGMIGKLEDWAHPQTHSSYLIFKAGKAEWVDFIRPLLDRSRYTREDGMRMSDSELSEFLSHAYDSIVYDGALKRTPGQSRGSAARANRGREHRQLHFSGADAYLRYHARFAEKSLMATIVGHVNQMSRDIALIETFGPNPDLMFRTFLDKAEQEAAQAGTAPERIHKQRGFAERLYDEVAGNGMQPGNETLARWASAVRSYLNVRLGSAVITSFADDATAIVTARALNMSGTDYLLGQIKALGSDEARRQARALGFGLDTALFAIDRFGQENLVNGFAAKVSGAVIRASGLSFMTEARRQGFAAMMMHQLGDMVRRYDSLEKLDGGDHSLLLAKGITDADWQIWRQAKPEEWQGTPVLTARAILNVEGDAKAIQSAADKFQGAILEEIGNAIIEPGARERAMTTGRLQPGTVLGELGRSVLQFKSFPITMMTRHWRRMLNNPGRISKAEYSAALIAGTTLMGAVGVQLNELLNGRDPLDMQQPAFWGRAALKGGSLGFYGDFLQSQASQHGTSAFAGMLGPSLGLTEELLNLSQGNIVQALQGEDTHAGAEALRMLKGITPGSSLWYAKGVMDHLIFQQLQEMVSPGYLRRMEQRAQREFKQSYWWKPGTNTPQRGPNLDRVTGQ